MTFELIAREIADKMGVTWPEVLGQSRRQRIADTRHAICGILRGLGMTYGDIALILRYDCHTSAINGARRYYAVAKDERDAFLATIESAKGVTRLFGRPDPIVLCGEVAACKLQIRRERAAKAYRKMRAKRAIWNSMGSYAAV